MNNLNTSQEGKKKDNLTQITKFSKDYAQTLYGLANLSNSICYDEHSCNGNTCQTEIYAIRKLLIN